MCYEWPAWIIYNTLKAGIIKCTSGQRPPLYKDHFPGTETGNALCASIWNNIICELTLSSLTLVPLSNGGEWKLQGCIYLGICMYKLPYSVGKTCLLEETHPSTFDFGPLYLKNYLIDLNQIFRASSLGILVASFIDIRQVQVFTFCISTRHVYLALYGIHS